MVCYHKQNRGLSLIELMIVLLIFGALAVIAIPRYLNLQQEARRAARDNMTGETPYYLELGFKKNCL